MNTGNFEPLYSIRIPIWLLGGAWCLLSLTGVCQAQPVPPGSILWLQADKGVVQQNGHVAVWQDQSGNGNDVRMDSIGNQPDFIDSSYPAIVFHGWNYMQGPSIFPVAHDYTVAGVFRLSDTTATNNIISGSDHAVYFSGSSFLHFHQVGFQVDAIASASSNPNGSFFIANFNAATSSVQLYIDGRWSDSLWTLQNDDSTILIGSFLGGYFLQGTISELLLYDRSLDSSETDQVNHYLESKYHLTMRPSPPPRDSTFSSIPSPEQFYSRDAEDSAHIVISGNFRSLGFDSIYLETRRNEVPVRRLCVPLNYRLGSASFSFETSIHSELSEYGIRVGVIRGSFDSTLASRDSLVCGDAFLVSGQSNAFIGFQHLDSLTEFCRTFGVDYNHNVDTQWSVANSVWPGFFNNICAWSYALSKLLIDSLNIPICVIDGALPGCRIEDQVPDDSNRLDMNTAYGLALCRTIKAGLQNSIRAIVWDQGEWNTDTNYYNNFFKLHSAWLNDYPAVQKVYVIQIRPNACNYDADQRTLREVQRHFQDSFPNLICHANAAMPQHDGCHLSDSGYDVWGSQMYHLFARDFYQSTDTVDIASPNLVAAFYTGPSHNEIQLVFDPPTTHIGVTADTVIYGILRHLTDYIYLDDSSGSITAIRSDGNSLILTVTNPSAHTISYLPSQTYIEGGVYEGPWIVTMRGVGAMIWFDVPISDGPLAVSEAESSVPDAVIVPNPTSQTISIDVPELSGPLEATLIAETGDVIWQKHLPPNHSSSLSFDLSSQSSGCYFLRLSDSITTIQEKLILER